MKDEHPEMWKESFDRQSERWSNIFLKNPNVFGDGPSDSAQKAANLFKKEGKSKILELGGGQGRDTIFFAQSGFRVYVLDFSESAVEVTTQKAQALGLSQSITTMCHDVRNHLPFDDQSFDACHSFALYSMALVTSELESLFKEVRRILKPGGFNIYTVRNTSDPHYGTGIHRGEDMYEDEIGPFIVHFFSKEKVARLAKGYEIIDIDEFEEGKLPRRLFRVTLIKK